MGKIKLLKRLWNHEKGEIINVDAKREKFAVRKGYAEPVIEEIKPKKAEPVKRLKKVEVTTRKKK